MRLLPKPHILTELSRVCGRGTCGLLIFSSVRFFDSSSAQSPISSECCESRCSESEEVSDESENEDREDGSAKCLEPETDNRMGWRGWKETEPIASVTRDSLSKYRGKKTRCRKVRTFMCLKFESWVELWDSHFTSKAIINPSFRMNFTVKIKHRHIAVLHQR